MPWARIKFILTLAKKLTTSMSDPPVKVKKEEPASPHRKGKRFFKAAAALAAPKAAFEGSVPELKGFTFNMT